MNIAKNKMCRTGPERTCTELGRSSRRSGAVLLVVLFIVMAATVLALGFISSSDRDLACGQNMTLKAQMDLLAETGLVHARGLILNPQDVDTETYGCWQGAENQQLAAGSSDYYEIGIVLDTSDHCNYIVDCNAYRLKAGEEIGRSSLRAQLRLDPCIALWTGTASILANSIRIDGDVYCSDTGNLANNAIINGDVFTDGTVSGFNPFGQCYSTTAANISWPGDVFSTSDLSNEYYISSNTYSVTQVDSNSYSYSGSWPSAGGSNPKKVYYCDHQLELGSDVVISGTLVVDSNLVITGANNHITAEKNFPALLVSGELIMRDGGGLDVDGLAVVTQRVVVDPNALSFSIDICGGLFINNGNITAPFAVTTRININASPQKTALRKWPTPSADPVDWSQASGAFFKSISKS